MLFLCKKKCENTFCYQKRNLNLKNVKFNVVENMFNLKLTNIHYVTFKDSKHCFDFIFYIIKVSLTNSEFEHSIISLNNFFKNKPLV